MLVKALPLAEVVARPRPSVKKQYFVHRRGVVTSSGCAKCCGFLQSKLLWQEEGLFRNYGNILQITNDIVGESFEGVGSSSFTSGSIVLYLVCDHLSWGNERSLLHHSVLTVVSASGLLARPAMVIPTASRNHEVQSLRPGEYFEVNPGGSFTSVCRAMHETLGHWLAQAFGRNPNL